MLYDGWPLVFEPGRPAALHLLEILLELPEGIDAWLALPMEAPVSLETHIHFIIDSTPGRKGIRANAARRMIWEQTSLPNLARKCQVHLLHTTTPHLPLLSPVPCLVSPAESFTARADASGGLAGRLRSAFGRGGLSNALIVWPADLPAPDFPTPIVELPVRVHPSFITQQAYRPDLPTSYVLAPGPLDEEATALLAATWSWAASGLDEDCVLLTTDLSEHALAELRARCQAAGVANPVEAAGTQSIEDRAALYQQAMAVLLVGPLLPWGDAFLQALACGCPLAAQETPWSDARVGPAGYLSTKRDPRALGAALLTLLVEEPVAEKLSLAARRRAAEWNSSAFRTSLAEIYEKAASASITPRSPL